MMNDMFGINYFALAGLNGFSVIKFTGRHPVLIDIALSGQTTSENKKERIDTINRNRE